MKTFVQQDFDAFSKAYRINFMNSLTGIKGAHLIGTKSDSGINNLGVFSNVVHIGARPALIGIIFRPSADSKHNSTNTLRHTLHNILHTNEFTLNHISEAMMPNAHLTSAKFDVDIDEFDECQLTPEYLSNCEAPFVKESPLKIALHYKELIPIKTNGTQLLVAQVTAVHFNPDCVDHNGRINFEKLGSLGVSGLNKYYTSNLAFEYPYARSTNKLTDFFDDEKFLG